MGFFERPDPRLVQSADPAPVAAVGGALKRHAFAALLCLIVMTGAYAANVTLGLHQATMTSGRIGMPGLYASVTIVRDRRDVPHIRAANEHDLYFAEGYVQGSDRLFQLDMARRYAYGRLAEVLGPKALPYDRVQRAVGIDGIAARQLHALGPNDRAALSAFSAGLNAAAAMQPLPVEFRILLYRPSPWTPKDSLAVSIVASLELADSWHDIFARDAVWRQGQRCFDTLFPLSDPRYDVTIDGVRIADSAKRAPAPACDDSSIAARRPPHPAIGSNAWAAGGRRTVDGRALIANDPHIDLTIPGIWYLVDIESPSVHAAGATIPGIPGVALGHNERIAWASTDAEMASMSLFRAGALNKKDWVTEVFHVRFSHDVRVTYYRTAREFSIPDDNDPSAITLVRWPIYAQRRSTIPTLLAIDRARDISTALRVLSKYRGSPQNFILADTSGMVAYHAAGLVPDDPAWGRYVHKARDVRHQFAPIPFARLPGRGPSRNTILISANNEPYPLGHAYRLSAQFQPPYRAYRIAELLRSRRRYDSEYFARMQLDALSPIDLEIARDVLRVARGAGYEGRADALSLLRRWDGRYLPASRAATLEHALRQALFEEGAAFGARLRELRGGSASSRDLRDEVDGTLASVASQSVGTWRYAGGVRIEHLLAPMNFGFLNGAWLPGAGDEYTIHVQESGIAQGFRAVWEVGNWDRGGISIPSGESGEPGSGHYVDLTRAWIRGELHALPFSRRAIQSDAASALVLAPQPSPR